jgi:glycine oxidase
LNYFYAVKVYDYMVVGQGLAGSSLALHLAWAGRSVLVVDRPAGNQSSRVAAGLFNPVTGKLLTKTWRADELFGYTFEFYRKAETTLATSFFYPQPIYRPFLSIEEQNQWMAAGTEWQPYLERLSPESLYGNQVRDPFGGIVLKSCGYVDVNRFLDSTRQWFAGLGDFVEDFVDDVSLANDRVEWKGFWAQRIVFCTGCTLPSLLSFLPVRPLKGETLTVKFSQRPNLIYNRGVYAVPVGQEYKIGATYQPGNWEEGITREGRHELEEKLKGFITIPFEVVGQEWGVRPATPDRRPMLGVHPQFSRVLVFNGLGTKGVSLSPFFGRQLALFLEGKGQIDQAVNINRFKALYSKFE